MKDIVYANNNVLGYFEKETYLQYSKAEKEKLENYPLFFVNIPQVKAAGGKQKGSKTLRR